MIALTDEAQARLDFYLGQVRLSLRGHRSVEPAEVERDIAEHIEGELSGVGRPVPAAELDKVLRQLGSPEQWVPAEDLVWWRKSLLRLRVGPEDWRLAYLSLGLLVLGFFVPPFLALAIPAAFLLARAAVALAGERGEALGAQRWLLYPALLLVYAPAAVALLGWPVPALFAFSAWWSGRPLPEAFPDLRAWIPEVGWAALATGVWLLLLSLVSARLPRLLDTLFAPFAASPSRWRTRSLLILGLVLLLGGAVLPLVIP